MVAAIFRSAVICAGLCLVPASLACAQPLSSPVRAPAPPFVPPPFFGPFPTYPQLSRSPLDALSVSPPTVPPSRRDPQDRQANVPGLPATGPGYIVDLDSRFDSPLIVALPATEQKR
ncbi:MAG TPA: hypothetical protein VGG99_06620 [Acetobacteraceae bacterium]|jgi:hypothetical protein